jgi:hypothetical protein
VQTVAAATCVEKASGAAVCAEARTCDFVADGNGDGAADDPACPNLSGSCTLNAAGDGCDGTAASDATDAAACAAESANGRTACTAVTRDSEAIHTARAACVYRSARTKSLWIEPVGCAMHGRAWTR